jgi:hypothetical protein
MVVEERIEVSGGVSEQPDQQGDLPAMVDAVNDGVLQQVPKSGRLRWSAAQGPLDGSIEVCVGKTGQK